MLNVTCNASICYANGYPGMICDMIFAMELARR